MPQSTCSIGECRKPHLARGMCSMHYSRARREGAPSKTAPKISCRVDQCEGTSTVRDLCKVHYRRLQRTGSLDGCGYCADCGDIIYRTNSTGPVQAKCEACKHEPRTSCVGCGTHIPRTHVTGPVSKYCSDECKPRCEVQGCVRPLRKFTWCANHYSAWRTHGDADAPLKYQWAGDWKCLTCGNVDRETWTTQRRSFCSNTCRVTWVYYGGNVPTKFLCAKCGVVVEYFDAILRKRLRSDAAYCSKHVRHARLYVTVEQLAAEDGTDCRLCGTQVDMSIPSPNPLSPSRDHIIPRALGGSDYRDNLQLAHRGCNSSKGHRYIG